jgi:hypothetical protein
MTLLYPEGDGGAGRIGLSSSDGLIDFAVKLAILAAAFVLNAQFAGLFAPVLTISLVQAKSRFAERWFPARKRQSAVTEALKALPDDYAVLNDLRLPENKVCIDHFVGGPNGLFVIEARNYAGEVKCEGYEWYVNRRRIPSVSRQAKNKAIAVRNSLAAPLAHRKEKIPSVVAVVVLTNQDAINKLYKPAVPVLRVEEVVDFIQNHKPADFGYVPPNGEEMRAIVRHVQSFRPKAATRLLALLRVD